MPERLQQAIQRVRIGLVRDHDGDDQGAELREVRDLWRRGGGG
jgi:hypothetical protein